MKATNEQNYETFESHLGGTREAYVAGDIECGSDLTMQATDNLLAVQRGRVDVAAVDASETPLSGAYARDADPLAVVGEVDATVELTNAVYEDFEDALTHSPLEPVLGELCETFGTTVEGAVNAGDAETTTVPARTTADVTVDASYKLASGAVAGTSRLTLARAVGFDAKVLTGLGGPGDELVHVAALSLYRVHAAGVP